MATIATSWRRNSRAKHQCSRAIART